MRKILLQVGIAAVAIAAIQADASAAGVDVLFLGDQGHHQPQARFAQIRPALAKRDIRLVYSERMEDLNAENLARYQTLLVYANIDRIEPAQEQALLDYVSRGGGFAPIHCASYCFRNSPAVVALMGAQFKRHGTGIFRTEIGAPDHPIMRGFGGFESWDETYVHALHNEERRTVLEHRVDGEGREPWTWIRTHGKGRVFYTAWGHDQRTWGNPGFQNLLERGLRWASGQDPGAAPEYLADLPFPVPKINPLGKDAPPFDYVEVGAKIPNYTPGRKWGEQGAPLSRMQQPLPADASLQHIVVPAGFRVELFASEPQIGGKPICMNWDERGRLWIAETYDYPNELQPEGHGRDRIRILEDSDGDGKADRTTVFADKLSIPTSLAFHRDGVIVQEGTQTLFLQDTDHDGVADSRRVLFTGWSLGDTHGGVSNFQYGLDNWIWAMQGYNQSSPAIDGRVQQSFRQGFFRFRPDGAEIEFIRSTNNNTWGLGISEEGLVFGSTANRNPSVFMPIPNRYYERVRGWTSALQLGTIADSYLFRPITDNVRQVDQHGGYTAAAGHALYTARQYPREYWNRTAFVNGPTGHLIGAFVLSRDGAGFKSTSPFNIFASDDEWTAPIMSEVGPDGNVWVVDWYNYIVQHNPTPQGFQTGRGNAYESDLRDKRHGRIYRVVHGDVAQREAGDSGGGFSLHQASPELLVETLTHTTMLWRRHAQRLLVERGDSDVVPRLLELVADRGVDEIGLNAGAIHALWTLHGLGQCGADADAAVVAAVHAALRHPSGGVRLNAARVLPPIESSTTAILESGLLDDSDLQAQLAGLLALSDLPPTPRSGAAIADAARRLSARPDRWLEDAAVSAAAMHAESFLSAVAGMRGLPSGPFLDRLRIVANHHGRTAPKSSIGALLAGLVEAEPPVADAILNGLAAGWPAGQAPPLNPRLESDLQQLMPRLPVGSRGVLIKLARSWGSRQFESYAREVSAEFVKRVVDESAPAIDRGRAARELVEFRPLDDELIGELLGLVTPQMDPVAAIAVVGALEASEAPALGPELTRQLPRLTPQSRAAALNVLLSRGSATPALLAAIDRGEVLFGELSLEQRQALAAHPDPKTQRLAEQLLRRGSVLPNADRQKVLEELLPLAKEEGDAAAGKEVFKKNCANCHVHGGEGQRIGPDLTGMAVHPKAELLTHIIDPSRDVEGNFRVYSVVTVDGLVINGLLASESRTSIEVYDAKGKKQAILREDIQQLKASRKSLMPEGFEKQVSAKQIVDLLQFLTARGKFLPLDLSSVASIASDQGMFNSKDSGVERMIFPEWGDQQFKGVPFRILDPDNGRAPNVVLLHGPLGAVCRTMPRSVTLPCNGPLRALHLLSGVSGWGHPYGEVNSISMIVRLRYEDGEVEDHPLRNGVHFADYIRRVDVPQSEFAFALRQQQIRYLAVYPKRAVKVREIELIKGEDQTAPIVMAATIES